MSMRPQQLALIAIFSIVVMMVSLGLSASDIPLAYRDVAASHQVPAKILYAIALTESGRTYHMQNRPWPWTINVDGKGAYCANQRQCIDRASAAVNQQQSVDIGLMQVNWYWHQHRFRSLKQAWHPQVNLRVGATILREHYDRTRDWWLAVGHYHAPSNKVRAKRYRQKVKHHWRNMP